MKMTELVTSLMSLVMSNNQVTSSRPTLHLSAYTEQREFHPECVGGPDTMLLVTMSVLHIPRVMMIPDVMINFTHIKAP